MTTELEKRNLIDTIRACLQEHTVSIGSNDMYLIEVNKNHSLLKDFMDAYEDGLDEFQAKLAKKLYGGEESTQTYGVLLNTDLKYVFAFNREFADIDREEEKISFKNMEDILLEKQEAKDLTDFVEPDFPSGNGGFDMHTVMRYALQGKKGGKNKKQSTKTPKFEMPSMLDRVLEIYSENTVNLQMGGKKKKLFLVPVSYETFTLDDFMNTYEDELDEFQAELAKKTFGEEKTLNDYQLFINEDLQIVLATNTLFGKYDGKEGKVVYTPFEDVLLGKVEKQKLDVSKLKKGSPKGRRNRRPGSTLMRYALVGKDLE